MVGLAWMILFSFLITGIYIVIIGRYYLGWHRLKVFSPGNTIPDTRVSIIIPFRNEREKIIQNFLSLKSQDFPRTQLEVIYVDDHSDDDTSEILMEHLGKERSFRLIHLNPSLAGKKDALKEGVMAATGELLMFTDADCYPVRTWVRTMAGYYMKYKPVMISGPVLIKEGNSLSDRFQALEFLSLSGSGAGSFETGQPVLCNGANLGFIREIYMENMNNMKRDGPSGDDIFMMLALKKKSSSAMRFLKSREAVVYTDPAENLISFLRQRMRWTSKTPYYRDIHIILTALTVLGINVWIAVLLIAMFLNKQLFIVFALVFILKLFIDFLLLHSVSSFFDRKKLLGLFFPSELLYIFYSIISAAGGLFLFPRWKGRKISNAKR